MYASSHKSDSILRKIGDENFSYAKSNEKQSLFFKNIRPLLILMKMCGLFPADMALNASSRAGVKISFVIFVYSLLLYLLVLYNVVLIHKLSIPRMVHPKTAFNTLINICVNLIVINLFTLIPYTHWLSFNSYVSHIFQWQQILANYEQIFGTSPDTKAKKCVYTGISMIFVMIPLLSGVLAYCLPDKLYVALEMCGIVIILTSSGTLWCQLCKNATIVGNDLRIQMKRTKMNSSSVFLCNNLRLWLRLSTITQEVGDIFTKLIAVSIFLTILSGVLASFGQIIRILKGYPSTNDTLTSSFFTVSDTFNLYTICNASYEASESVGRKMTKTILSRNYTRCNLLHLQQTEIFLQTIKISKPQIHLAGFIRINRKLLVKIYSMLITCLIVLTQFQLTLPFQMY